MKPDFLVGYKLSCQDDGSYMFPDDMSAAIRRNAPIRLSEYESGIIPKSLKITKADILQNKCPLCGYRLDFQPHNKDYKRKRRSTDIGCTYDGQTIVSVKFKEFCIGEKLQGLVFREFATDKSCFQFIVTEQIVFDSKRRGTRFERLCQVCGNYESVVGVTPVYLRISNPLPRGFFRSNLLFASGNEKHPITLISSDIKSEMEKAGLRGVEFHPAYGNDCS